MELEMKPTVVSISYHCDDLEIVQYSQFDLPHQQEDCGLSAEIESIKRICDAINDESSVDFEYSLST